VLELQLLTSLHATAAVTASRLLLLARCFTGRALRCHASCKLCLLLRLAVYALAEPFDHRCLAHSTVSDYDHFDFTLQMCMQYQDAESAWQSTDCNCFAGGRNSLPGQALTSKSSIICTTLHYTRSIAAEAAVLTRVMKAGLNCCDLQNRF
jgi:hypothetical protein